MINTILSAEQQLDAFLPTLKSMYPEGRNDTVFLKQLAAMYEGIVYDDGVVVVLYDHRTASVIFLNKNSDKITGYKRETMLKWGGLIMFKMLHYTHYSYIYAALRVAKNFDNKLPLEERKDIQFCCCGLKLIGGDGITRRGFIKSKVLLLDDRGQVDISIFFVQDVSHLLKGEHYWIRVNCNGKTLAYVQTKGKKKYNDLLSDRELEILKLVAQQKSTWEIAEELNLSKLTVDTHRKNMLRRTGAVDFTALLHLCKLANIL